MECAHSLAVRPAGSFQVLMFRPGQAGLSLLYKTLHPTPRAPSILETCWSKSQVCDFPESGHACASWPCACVLV